MLSNYLFLSSNTITHKQEYYKLKALGINVNIVKSLSQKMMIQIKKNDICMAFIYKNIHIDI